MYTKPGNFDMSSSTCSLSQIRRTIFLIGIIELVASISVFGFGIATTLHKSRLYHMGHGIWAGAIFVGSSCSAMAGGVAKSPRVHLACHFASCVVACIFILPGLTTFLFIERVSDSMYSYWTDPPACRNGCYSPAGDALRMNVWPMYGQDSGSERVPCDSEEWNSSCHPNITAVSLETASLAVLAVLIALFMFSASLACWILCRCAGRDEVRPLSPTDTMIVYTTYAVPNYPYFRSSICARPAGQDDPVPHYQSVSPSAPPPTYDEVQKQFPVTATASGSQNVKGMIVD